MISRLQSIRDILAQAALGIPADDQVGKLVRKALLQANAGLLDYPQRPVVRIPTVSVDGVDFTVEDVKDLIDNLIAATDTLLSIANTTSDFANTYRSIAAKTYDQIMRKDKHNGNQNSST